MSKIFTYQTRPFVQENANAALAGYGDLYGHVERKLFVALIQGQDLNLLKQTYLIQYGITGRQFNACRISLQGKIEGVKEATIRHIALIKERIASLTKKIPKIRDEGVRHLKTRKLIALKRRLLRLEQEHKEGKVSLCFGGKKLFRAQYSLEANGYDSFADWKKDWVEARSSEFFCLGSKDEVTGNQSCVLRLDENQMMSLRLRLPDALIKEHGKYLIIPNVTFSYGQKEIERALKAGTALSYRFKRDEKGWRIFISFKQEAPAIVTRSCIGAIGIDINVNHIAAVEIDAKGNPVSKHTVPLNTYGKSKDQSKALIGDVCKEILDLAKTRCKPIVFEKLDFTKKKTSLKETSPKQARMLSSFHYSKVLEGLEARAFKEGVETFSVNPAMTSIIGKIKFSKRYGLTTHHGAALCIARRHYKFSEAPSKSPMKIVHKNVQVTCPAPVRKRGQHVWGFWKESNRKLKTVLAALFRASPCPS